MTHWDVVPLPESQVWEHRGSDLNLPGDDLYKAAGWDLSWAFGPREGYCSGLYVYPVCLRLMVFPRKLLSERLGRWVFLLRSL